MRGAVLLLPPTLAQEVSHDKKSTRKSLFGYFFGYLFFKSLVYSVDCGEDESDKTYRSEKYDLSERFWLSVGIFQSPEGSVAQREI